MKEEKVKEIKKKIIDKAVDKGLEVVIKPIKEAIQDVEKRLNNPVDEMVNAVGELTTAQQLLSVIKKYNKDTGLNAIKKAENMGIAALSLLPVLGTVSTDLVDAAIVEGATAAQAQTLAKGAQVVGGAGEVAYPLSHLVGEKAASKVASTLKALDPFPDIDPKIVLACGAAGIVIPGVGAIPSGIEIAILTIKDIKNTVSTVGEMGSIISKSPELRSVKDFSQSVVQSVTKRIQRAGSPQMTQARAAFGVA